MSNGVEKLFYYITEETPYPRILEILKESAKCDLEKTIKLVFNIRDVTSIGRGGYRDIGRYMFQWLFIQYPNEMNKTFRDIPKFGRWDDLLYLFPNVLPLYDRFYLEKNYFVKLNEEKFEKIKKNQENVVYFYINQLKKDKKYSLKNKEISCASKWIPNEKSEFNRKYGIIKTICEKWKLSPRILRKEYITPLRDYMGLIERRLCNQEVIYYEQLSSSNLYKYRKYFKKVDSKGFNTWVSRARSKNKHMIYPHEIFMLYNTPFVKKYNTEIDLSLEHNYNCFLETHTSKYFENSLAIVDVNERMKKEGEKYEFNCKYFINIALSCGYFISNLNDGKISSFNNPIRNYTFRQTSIHNNLEDMLKLMVSGQKLNQENLINLIKNYKGPLEKIYIFTDKRFQDIFEEEFDDFKYSRIFKKKQEKKSKKEEGKKEEGKKEEGKKEEGKDKKKEKKEEGTKEGTKDEKKEKKEEGTKEGTKDEKKEKKEEGTKEGTKDENEIEKTPPKIYIWNFNERLIQFKKIDKFVYYIEGCSENLIKSFFVNGFQNPEEEIDEVLKSYD